MAVAIRIIILNFNLMISPSNSPAGSLEPILWGIAIDFEGVHHGRSSKNPAFWHAFKKGALRKLSSTQGSFLAVLSFPSRY